MSRKTMKNATTLKGHPRIPGLVIHWAGRYDLMVWLFTFGRERAFREKILSHARLQPGEVVLDVGCGTGTLAILAERQVGPTGAVHGIDASPEMISRAAWKAKRQGVPVRFQVAAAQALPFADAHLDVVLTTLMLHHLPRPSRQQLAREICRVLRPGGRVLAVDFGQGGHDRKKFLGLFHRPHGHTKLQDMVTLVSEAGLTTIQSGAVGAKDLQFVLATKTGDAVTTAAVSEGAKESAKFDEGGAPRGAGTRAGGHAWSMAIVLAIVLAIASHIGFATSLFANGTSLPQLTSLGVFGLVGIVILKVLVKAGFILGWRFRRHAKRNE